MYQQLVAAIGDLLRWMEESPAFQALDAAPQEAIRSRFFGPEAPLGQSPHLPLTTADDLITATEKLSLAALESLHLALPAHHQAILQAIQNELAKPKPEAGPQPKLYFWNPSQDFAGKTFKSKAELEQQLQAVARKLEQLLEEGYTIIVE